MIRYHVIATELTLEGQNYIGYGIDAECDGEVLKLVPDVSLNRADMEELARRCTEEELAPEHLNDVIEDYLAVCHT